MKNISYKIIFQFWFIIWVLILTSCETSEKYPEEIGTITFIGEVYDNEVSQSRAPAVTNITRSKFDTDFYIESVTDKESKCRLYRVPEDWDGVLRSYGTADSLKWTSLYDNHTFYSWTMPWTDDSYMENPSSDVGTRISFDQNNEMYNDVKSKNKNCAILETFVGAKAGPLTYVENGEYVPLRFQHLVSKINIKSIRFTYTLEDGTIKNQDNITGKITFINMPSEGIFVRHGDARPLVKANEEAENEVTYDISTNAWLYICPDVDFSKVEFRIKADNVDQAGDFLGDFSSITFDRVSTDWWDKEHSGSKILYAGEFMTLEMTLRRGSGTLISVSISPWSTQYVREANSYPYKGIYDESILRSFYNTFNEAEDYSKENEDRMFDLYGDYDADGNPEYRLYNDITINQHRIPTGRECWLNGMGHTVTFETTYSNNRVGVSWVKDIYLSDTNGHTVYIDENFLVYRVKADGSLERALDNKGNQYKLEKLEDPYLRHLINLETGEVSKSKDP